MSANIVRWGIAAAAVLGVLHLVAALWNPVLALPQALIFFTAAWGLHRRRSWSGYGAALFVVAFIAGMGIGSFRSAGLDWSGFALSALIYAAPALLLFLAGRATGPAPLRSGSAWLALGGATFALFVILQPFVIPTGAMEDTVLVGDHLFVQRVALGSPSRGDLVVVRPPGRRDNLFVKRVVAVAGDTVKLRNKKLYVNGQAQQEPWVTRRTEYVDPFRDNFPQEPTMPVIEAQWAATLKSSAATGQVTVPQGHVFVLGDNRDNSLDSRYFGFVPRADVVGKPRMIYFSVDNRRNHQPALLSPSSVRWGRIFTWL